VPDLGGRIWRFDIKNGNVASDLVVGGLFATLGTADQTAHSNAAARRFFYTTDVAPIQCDGQLFLNISIGSGHRELPKSDRITQDGFYGLRDYNVYSVIDTANYRTSGSCDTVDGPCHLTITLPELQDVSQDPNPVIVSQNPDRPRPAGWKLMFTNVGEKVLAESITFQGNVFFTTYEPRQLDSPNACTDIFGLNKLYIVSACNARPPQDLNRNGVLNEIADRSVELRQQGIAAPPAIIFPPRSVTGPGGLGSEPCGPGERPGIGITGTETFFPGCIGKPVRTYWRQRGVPEGG
jgi:type IV pilus assembly protein PilY1